MVVGVLVVLGALEAVPEAERALERLGARADATTRAVGSLRARTHRALIDQLLT